MKNIYLKRMWREGMLFLTLDNAIKSQLLPSPAAVEIYVWSSSRIFTDTSVEIRIFFSLAKIRR
jgi:hypothetical protein